MVSQIPINLFLGGGDTLRGNVYHNKSISILGDIYVSIVVNVPKDILTYIDMYVLGVDERGLSRGLFKISLCAGKHFNVMDVSDMKCRCLKAVSPKYFTNEDLF